MTDQITSREMFRRSSKEQEGVTDKSKRRYTGFVIYIGRWLPSDGTRWESYKPHQVPQDFFLFVFKSVSRFCSLDICLCLQKSLWCKSVKCSSISTCVLLLQGAVHGCALVPGTGPDSLMTPSSQGSTGAGYSFLAI